MKAFREHITEQGGCARQSGCAEQIGCSEVNPATGGIIEISVIGPPGSLPDNVAIQSS